MSGTRLGATRETHDVVSSTMEPAAAAARAGAADGHVVLARRQTAGRGRTGRVWHSDDDGGLYLSVVLRGFDGPTGAAGLTLAAGLGVAAAVRRLGTADVRLKWPNDVLLGERKVAGILSEWLGEGTAVVGVGLNVGQTAFPAELAATATSLALATGAAPTPEAELEVLLEALGGAVAAFRTGGLAWVVPEWTGRSGLWGRRCTVAGVTGVLRRLDPDGALVLESDDGTERRLTAGAVELL
ncbi:MAG: biotin--[acetyl-CoA-carboxylase] ligase [Deltaproteobacteria bacterium]|nr:biotin--[acetyl-CoA-carboxylase] ligase [Deltaproteobacteria bacterium]